MPQTTALLTVMIAAVRKAARALARDFGEVENLQVSRKGPGDFVTNADKRSEKILFDELSRARPGYGFLMEERGEVPGTDKTNRFIVDPLDGTTNFMHGNPHFCISVALEREKELVAGVVYDVIKDELFWAEKGQGAYLNDKRLRVSGRANLADSAIAVALPHQGRANDEKLIKEIQRMAPLVAAMRSTGSAALDLAYVAAGRFDGYWDRALKFWDIAGGAVIVREAGGFAREPDGKDFTDTGAVLAANDKLFAQMMAVLKN